MDGVRLDIDVQALLRELQAIPDALRKRVMRGAVATAASVVRKASIERAPIAPDVGTHHPPPGTLKRAIYQVRLPERCTANLEIFKVDVRTGKKASKSGAALPDAYYAKFVEYGHFTRTPRSIPGTRKQRREIARATGRVRWVPPRPFMRPAFEASKADALRAMQDYMRKAIPPALAANRIVRAIG